MNHTIKQLFTSLLIVSISFAHLCNASLFEEENRAVDATLLDMPVTIEDPLPTAPKPVAPKKEKLSSEETDKLISSLSELNPDLEHSNAVVELYDTLEKIQEDLDQRTHMVERPDSDEILRTLKQRIKVIKQELKAIGGTTQLSLIKRKEQAKNSSLAYIIISSTIVAAGLGTLAMASYSRYTGWQKPSIETLKQNTDYGYHSVKDFLFPE